MRIEYYVCDMCGAKMSEEEIEAEYVIQFNGRATDITAGEEEGGMQTMEVCKLCIDNFYVYLKTHIKIERNEK